MLVKTLLKTLEKTEYSIVTEYGTQLESEYIDTYRGESRLENRQVSKVYTVKDCDILFIKVK